MQRLVWGFHDLVEDDVFQAVPGCGGAPGLPGEREDELPEQRRGRHYSRLGPLICRQVGLEQEGPHVGDAVGAVLVLRACRNPDGTVRRGYPGPPACRDR